eukprot:GFUD01022598.1.p1 GENE.GFUD01022598.1~~GFUD01022598.1.p1  ORF type:complete len:340 (+),score=103.77 GFUD01022598.1:125-1144(+)
MSFFTNIVRYVKESYSEINAATLTGAIDVIVVQQEDETLKSSPFHVRFGKLGVLKTREKIVDLEVNGEPVLIQMKLGDTGEAFFVEDVANSKDSWNVDLATSPIPDQAAGALFCQREAKIGTLKLKPTKLFEETEENKESLENVNLPKKLEESGKEDVEVEIKSRKGKLNKKKRKRRNQLKHRRQGSRTSQNENFQETVSLLKSTDDLVGMDDANDADQEDELSSSEPEIGSSLPTNLNLKFLRSIEMERTDSTSSELAIENSLIGSRVPLHPKCTSEAEALEATFAESRPESRPTSFSQGLHYFSDGEGGSRGGHSALDPPSIQVKTMHSWDVVRFRA